MSYDRQIDQICPHQVTEEALFVGSDRMTVKPLRPIASIASIDVFLNHEIGVPSIGVALPGQAIGGRRGPFSVQAGVNDTLSVSVNQGPVQTVVIHAANNIPPERLVATLNGGIEGVFFSVYKNAIQFRTIAEGRKASVFILGSSTLAPTLGIESNREYRGQQLVPGWTLVRDPTTLDDRPTRLLIFDTPLKSTSDFVEISYSTIQAECRRCGGTGVEHDFRYGVNGEPITAVDETLLVQELQKNFYTVRGSNPFHLWYGSGLLETIGKKLSAAGFVQNLIVSDIYQSFNRWQSIKRQQEEKIGQTVTDEEYPFRLLSVDLEQSTQDPTVVFVNITVQNRSNKAIQLTRGLRIPQPADLLGSTQQQGIIRQSLSNFVMTG